MQYTSRGAFLASLLVCLSVVSLPTSAVDLPPPQGEVLLTFSGHILNHTGTSDDGKAIAQFDLAMLEQLPVTTFDTETPWTDERSSWTGVRLNEILDYLGATSMRMRMKALDGYNIVFEGIDIDNYPIILAYKRAGKTLPIRALGPIWVMFPFDDYPELAGHENSAMAVWQLLSIEVL